MTEPPAAPPRRRRWPRIRPVPRLRFRWSVRALLLLVAAVGLAMGLGRFRLANRDPERAWVTRQVRAMRAPDPAARLSAIEGLSSAGPEESSRAVPALVVAATGDADPAVRRAAVEMLGSVSRKAATAPAAGGRPAGSPRPPRGGVISATLIEALADADATVRAAAAKAMPGAVGPEAVAPLSRRIDGDRDATVRAEAIRALAAIAPPDAPAPDALIGAIGDPDPAIRREARRALRRSWADPDRIAAALLRLGEAADPEERVELAIALSGYDAEAASRFVPELVEALGRRRDGPTWIRVPIAEALGRIGPAARPALAELRHFAEAEFAGSPGHLHWMSPCGAIAAIDPDSDEARAVLGPLVEQLSSDSTVTAHSASLAIYRFGPSARSVLHRLREIAEDPDRDPMARGGALTIIGLIEDVDDSRPVDPDRLRDDEETGGN